MKILLIGINAKYIHPSLAIYQLKENTSYPVLTKEFTLKESLQDIYQEILSEDPDVVGFSCYLWNINSVLMLIEKLKKIKPKLITILGGPEVAYDSEYFLTNFQIDYIIRSEGELAFDQFLNFLHDKCKLNEVPSISYLKNGQIIHNPVVLPDLSTIKLAPLSVNNYQTRVVYLESSRGCLFNCSYCCASLEKQVRFFPLDKIFTLLDVLMKERVKTVKFLDRTFNANKDYFWKILSFIKEHNQETTFQFEIVADRLDLSVIPLIASFPKKWLRFEIGIQSTNDIVNASVNRKQDMDRLKNAIELLQETNKVDLHVDLIAGLPYETKESFIKSFNEVFLLYPKELQLGFLKFLRGTNILRLINEHKYIYQSEPPYEIIENKHLTTSDLQEIKQVEETLEKYYNSGWFKETFLKLKNLKLIDSYYHFFLSLAAFLTKQDFKFIGYQRHDLYILLNKFFRITYPAISEELEFSLLQDYLLGSKTKPKLWWNHSLSRETRTTLYPLIASKIPSLKLEDLYRYSIVITFKQDVFIIIYQGFQPKHYLLHDLI